MSDRLIDEEYMKNNTAMIQVARLAMHALVVGVFCATASAPAQAQAQAQVKVSVSILKRASLQVLAQPSSVTVTAADLARGYVDVPAASQVAVRSNAPAGYLLEFASQGDFMRQILVRGLDTDVQLSPAGGMVSQRGASKGVTKTTLALGFRFLLSESAQEGTYAWPMRLAVVPL
jgi:hypothetical protein